MIHRDSRKSPFYNPKLTLEDSIDTPPVCHKFLSWTLVVYYFGFIVIVATPIEGGERSPYPLYVYSESSSYIEDVFCETPTCELIMLKGKCGRGSKRSM
ncbi:hypothetical protein KY285_031184 [Solanum tuberosum]|nr:hypothetical protein KY285_031184 [Solanum tuberosum]